MQNKVTIVVPSKNEEKYIGHLLDHLIAQEVGFTKIVVADCSSDRTREVVDLYRPRLNLEVIEGGPVSIAKNRGAKLATTEYILFIDSDVRFFKPGVIKEALDTIERENLDLVGLNIRCYDGDRRAQLGFYIFNFINNILKYRAPFAVGAFFFTRRDRFWELGGFSETLSTSEDYFLSRQYSPQRFRLLGHHFGQDSRRFQRMGYFGMARYLVQNFWNRHDRDYWDRLDNSKYWN